MYDLVYAFFFTVLCLYPSLFPVCFLLPILPPYLVYGFYVVVDIVIDYDGFSDGDDGDDV